MGQNSISESQGASLPEFHLNIQKIKNQSVIGTTEHQFFEIGGRKPPNLTQNEVHQEEFIDFGQTQEINISIKSSDESDLRIKET